MTELELLQKIITVLGSIKVPCALAEEITIPIAQCRNSLIEIVQIKKAAQEEQKEENDEIKLEVVPEDEQSND